MPDPTLPGPVADAIERWITCHDDVAPGVVEGLYLVGSVALHDWTPNSDVDVVGFVADPTDRGTVSALEAAHHAYGVERDGPMIDGPFLSWADVGTPPLAVARAWSLDGEFRFDGECFEINPVTWYTLAEYGVAVRGPERDSLGVYLDDTDRRVWVRENVDTYWRTVRDDLLAELEAKPERDEFRPETVEWCVLGAARMWFTAETGGVASKRGAGVWVADRLPAIGDVVDLAIRIRESAGPVVVGREAIVAVVDAMGAVIDAVVRS